ncbi:hypothetical protein ACE6H2_020387 [Prunus campanulata]
MVNLIGLVDPGLVSSQSGTITDRIKNLSSRLKTADGNQFFLVPYNPGSPRKQAIWKNLHGTPEQPTSVECGYYVMRFMRDIIHDPDLDFEKKFEKKKDRVQYTQEHIDEVRHEWAKFVNKLFPKDN